MNLKPKYCVGVVVICSIAVVTFHSGVCEPAGYSSRTFEQRLNNDTQSVQTAAMLKARRRHLVSRMRPNIHPKFIKSVEHLGQTSTSAMSALGPAQDQYQNNPYNHFKTNCNKGEVKRIRQGRFDIAGAGQASTTLLFPSGSLHSDSQTQTEVRGDQQPVVQCTEASMTLRVPRKWAAQLRVGTGNYFSFPLSKLPPQCGYSIHKSWRDIYVVVQYNGCHVTQEGARYVLPLLWLRTPVKISCPVSPLKSQAVVGLSLCCSSFGITIRIQGPSAAKELHVNVRGEWTPLRELVQHCGYSMDRSNAETIITAPFLACGITSRDGNRELSLQIGAEVFALTCRLSPLKYPSIKVLN
uniref:Vitelline envelope sperm lysin receptor n=1 Tax=Neogobius melanostomus TaxID=47308 RepID=A0A8C6SP27_9GOBI